MAYLLQTVKWGLVVGAAALVLAPLRPRLDRRYRARWRYWLWMVLAFALLLAPLPWSSLLPEAAEEALVPAVVLEVPRTLGPAAKTTETNNNNSGGQAVRPSPPAETGGGTAAGAETAAPPAQTFPAIRWDRALPALWLIVAALLLLWRLLGSWRFSRRARRWSRAPGEAVLAACRSAEAELGMRREIPVWICPLADSPMAVGLFRPRLLLPDEDYDARRLRFILRHELTHIRRRDLWYKLLLLAAACLHWFDPLVWLLRRQAERDLELTCDDAVTAGLSGGDRRAYGETLLADLGRRRGLASPLSTRFRGGKAAMKERLRNLLAAPRRWGGPALAAALALVALAACSFGIRQAAAPTPLEEAELAVWQERLNSEAWNASLLRMYTDPETMTISDDYLAARYPLYPREAGGDIPMTNWDFSEAERRAVNETGAVPTDIPPLPVFVHSGTTDGDTVSLEIALGRANASGFTDGTLTVQDGRAVRFTTPLYEAAETAALAYVDAAEAAEPAASDSRIAALVRGESLTYEDAVYSVWYLRYQLQSRSTGEWMDESASLGGPFLLFREDGDGAVTLLETRTAGTLEVPGLVYYRDPQNVDGYTWEEYLLCKHHLGMALGTRAEGWPELLDAFLLDLEAGRQTWTQDMTATALTYLGTQGHDLEEDDLHTLWTFSAVNSSRPEGALLAADCGDWTAILLLSQLRVNGLDLWQVNGCVWDDGERQVSDPVGRRETVLYEAEDVAFGPGLTGDLTLHGFAGNDVADVTKAAVTWTQGREGTTTFRTREAIADAWGQDSLDYAANSALPDGGLLLEDLNFDGYLDIALQGWTAAHNQPLYLWFFDPATGLFAYGGCVNGPLTVDGQAREVVAETVDQAGALHYRDVYRPDGLGGLYLARRETWTLEGQDYVLTEAEDFAPTASAGERALTEGELQTLAAWFDQPENNGLLRFPYDEPADAGDFLGQLFYDMGHTDWDSLPPSDRETLTAAGLPEWMDLFARPRTELVTYLQEKFGIGEDAAESILDNAADPPGDFYLETNDTWYATKTDTMHQSYLFPTGRALADGTWEVEYVNDFLAVASFGPRQYDFRSDFPMRLTVRPVEDGWVVVRHQPAAGAENDPSANGEAGSLDDIFFSQDIDWEEFWSTFLREGSMFKGSYHRNFDELILEYETLNTTLTWSVDLSEGDSLAVDLVVDAGDLSVLIEDEEGNVFYQNDNAETGAFDLEVAESSQYTVTVVGIKTQGKASFKKV